MLNGEGIIVSSLTSLVNVRQQMHTLQLAKRHIKARHAGLYRSAFKGRGMDFAESRPYQAGDDIRSIDWRVTARTGEVHTKIFQEERECPVMVWVDLRPAMFFATKGCFKSVLAAEVAALIVWKTLSEGDRIGGFLQQASHCTEIKPMRSRSAVLHLLRQLAQSTQTTTVAPIIRPKKDLLLDSWTRLRRVATHGTQVVVISDFRGASERALKQLAMIRHSAEVTLISIRDPFEQRLPPKQKGRLRLTDGRRSLWVSLQSRWSQEYQQRAAATQQNLQDFARSYRMPLINLSTEQAQRERLRLLSRGLA